MPAGDDRVRAEDLAVVMVPIDSVQPHPMNNNVGDVDTIAESMDELGFFDPITVQKSSGNIITGNHTWKVRKAKGLTDIAAIVVDVSDFNALRMMAVHNRSNRKGHEDGQATFDLLQTLQDLGHEDYGLSGTGYDLDDVEALLAEYGQAEVPTFPDDEPPALIPRQAIADDGEEEDEPESTRTKSAPRLTGMKETVIVLPAAEASDLARALASCRKRMPGGYPTGRIAYAAVRYLELALDSGAPHPEPCPCDNCADHGEACACLECTAARAAAVDDDQDQDDGAEPDDDGDDEDQHDEADGDGAELPAAASAAAP